MIREIDLVGYLPSFVAEYKEISAALKAEEPEFTLVWEAADRALRNEFIETADEYGIQRFEDILKIFPSKEDTLESRRSRVRTRWIGALPYTERMLLEKLAVLCGGNNFALIKKYENYKIELEVSLEMYGQLEELERMLGEMLPCNMTVMIRNTIAVEAEGCAAAASGGGFAECLLITNDSKETVAVNGAALYGGSLVNTADVAIIDDFKE